MASTAQALAAQHSTAQASPHGPLQHMHTHLQTAIGYPAASCLPMHPAHASRTRVAVDTCLPWLIINKHFINHAKGPTPATAQRPCSRITFRTRPLLARGRPVPHPPAAAQCMGRMRGTHISPDRDAIPLSLSPEWMRSGHRSTRDRAWAAGTHARTAAATARPSSPNSPTKTPGEPMPRIGTRSTRAHASRRFPIVAPRMRPREP